MSKSRITVTVDPDLVERIDRIAELRDTSRSRIFEILLEVGVQEEERTMKTLGNPVIGPIVQGVLDHPKLVQMIAAAIGEKLSPEEYAKWQEAGPAVKKIRGNIGDERGRRTDLRPEGA